MREVFLDKLLAQINLSKSKEDYYFLCADVGFSFVEKVKSTFKNNFLNVGVAERNMLAVAAGLASQGKKVFCYSIGPFQSTEGYSVLRNDISYHNSNVCLINGGAGFQYGNQGYTHHAFDDLNLVSNFDNIEILNPGHEEDLDEVVKRVFDFSGPQYLRLGRNDRETASIESEKFSYGIKIFSQNIETAIISSGVSSYEFLELGKFAKLIHLPVINNDSLKIVKSHLHKIKKVFFVEECLFPGPLFRKLYKDLANSSQIESVNIEIEREKFGSRQYLNEKQGFCPKVILNQIGPKV